MTTRTLIHRARRYVAGAVFGLFTVTQLAHASVDKEEQAAVARLLSDRGQPTVAASLPSPVGSEQAEVSRLLAQPLTAAAAVRLALLQHREVRAALVALGIPRGQLLTAGLPPNPEVEISLRAPQAEAQPLQAEIGVDYEISALILLPLRRSVAHSELQAERLRAASLILTIAYGARQAFYDAAAALEQQALRQRALQVAEAAYAVRAELARVGNIPALDLQQERAAMESARLDVTEAELSAKQAREQLNAALGLVGTQTAWSLASDALTLPPDASDAQIEQRVVDASFELAALRSQATGAEQRARLQRVAGALPHLGAGFHGEHDGTAWELGGHVSLSLPLLNQGQGAVAASRAEARSLRERVAAAEAVLRARLRATQSQLSLSLSRAQILREGVVPARQQALREMQLQYNGMQVSVFQLLDARRGLFDAQAAQVEALRQALQARARLDLLLAGGRADLGDSSPRVPGRSSPGPSEAH